MKYVLDVLGISNEKYLNFVMTLTPQKIFRLLQVFINKILEAQS